MKTILKILVIVIIVFTNSLAQLTHTFTQTARNTHYGEVNGVAVDSNSTVFLAMGKGGLRAYSYDCSSFLKQVQAKAPTNQRTTSIKRYLFLPN